MTEKTTGEGAGLAAFAQVLETFGSDRTRWPAPVRRDFAGLLATSAEAQAKLRLQIAERQSAIERAAHREGDEQALGARRVARG